MKGAFPCLCSIKNLFQNGFNNTWKTIFVVDQPYLRRRNPSTQLNPNLCLEKNTAKTVASEYCSWSQGTLARGRTMKTGQFDSNLLTSLNFVNIVNFCKVLACLTLISCKTLSPRFTWQKRNFVERNFRH